MIAWVLVAAAVAANVMFAADGWRAMQRDRLGDIVTAGLCFGVSLLVTALAVLVAICSTRADA